MAGREIELSRRSFLGAAAGAALLGTVARRAPGGRTPTARTPSSGARGPSAARLDRLATPTGPPPITVTQQPEGVAPGYILLTPAKSTDYENGPLIVDSAGNVIWFQSASDSVFNLQMQTYRKQPVLTYFEGELILPGYGHGDYVILDTSYDEVARVSAKKGQYGDLHEFVITPRNTALFTLYETQRADLSPVGGPTKGWVLNSRMQEVDIKTGNLLMEWSAAHHIGYEESYMAVPSPNSSAEPWDFFHINSIDVDTDGNLLVSSRHCWCIYKINRTTGKVMWRLNGKASDFVMGKNTHFYWQHHARHQAGNMISLFDDGSGPAAEETHSRGLVLQLDLTSMTATLAHQYRPNPRLLSSSQGSTQLLPNGNVFIGWGSSPYFSEYTAEGKMIYNAMIGDGVTSYRAFRSPWPSTS